MTFTEKCLVLGQEAIISPRFLSVVIFHPLKSDSLDHAILFKRKKKTKKLLKSDTESIAASIIYWCIIYTAANPYHTDAEPAYCICKNLVAMTKLCKKSLVKDIELHNQCGFFRGVYELVLNFRTEMLLDLSL